MPKGALCDNNHKELVVGLRAADTSLACMTSIRPHLHHLKRSLLIVDEENVEVYRVRETDRGEIFLTGLEKQSAKRHRAPNPANNTRTGFQTYESPTRSHAGKNRMR